MKFLRKTGKPDQVVLERADKKALADTIDLCALMADWLDDDQADGAAGVLSRLQDKYVPKEGGEADGK